MNKLILSPRAFGLGLEYRTVVHPVQVLLENKFVRVREVKRFLYLCLDIETI